MQSNQTPAIFHSLKQDKRWLLVMALGLLIGIGLSLQAHFTTKYDDGRNLTNYNNYVIFRQSYVHLSGHQDLYLKYKYEYWDLFKYTPTFAMLMAPFAWIPAVPGLIIWNLLNIFVLLFAIKALPVPDEKKKILMLAFCVIELITSVQNEQSNGLVAGLLIGGLALAEQKKFFLAAGVIILCGFIKIIGLAALAIFLFYPKFWRHALYCSCWTVLLFALPLLVISPHELQFQYGRWLEILAEDTTGYSGLSVVTMLRSITGLEIAPLPVQLGGLILLCLPLVRMDIFRNITLRIHFVALILIWIVIFNHKAESPTFIIAVSGVALWYFNATRNKWHHLLLILCLVFTQLSATDLFPEKWQTGFFHDWAVKAIPCLMIWVVLLAGMIKAIVGRNMNVDVVSR
jgi:hypothetical protein